MAEHGTLRERLQSQVANPLIGRLAELEANEQADPVVVETPEEAAVHEEERGVGKTSFDFTGNIKKIKETMARLKASARGLDPEKEASLLARIAVLETNRKLAEEGKL